MMRNLSAGELILAGGGEGDGSLGNPYIMPPVTVTPPQNQVSGVTTISDPTQIGIFLDSLPGACSGTALLGTAAGGAFVGAVRGAIAGLPGLLPGVLIGAGTGAVLGAGLAAGGTAITCAVGISAR